MRKRVCSTIGVLLLLCNLSAFAHTAIIENSGSKQYKAVRLTPEIYQNTKANLSDLLLYDENNQAVPYFINRYTQNSSKIQESYEAKQLDAFVKEDKFYFDFGLNVVSNQDRLATGIQFETRNQNFAKDVVLYGSYDNRNWEWIQADSLYRVEGKEKLEITFGQVQKYSFYRMQLANNLEKISFQRVQLVYNDEIKSKDYFIEAMNPQFTSIQEGKTTVIRIEGIKNLEIEEIKLETDNMFQRPVRYANKGKMLYHLMFGQTVYEDLSLPLSGYQNTEDVFSITIQNGDDKPIQIKNITVTYHVSELIFEGTGNSYTLSFGTGSEAAPSYDIVNYKDWILKGGYDMLSFGEITFDKKPAEVGGRDYKFLFNIVIVFVALLLGLVMIGQLKKKSEV